MSTERKHQRQLQLFLPKSSPKFIAIDILGPLTRTMSCNQYVVTITDWYCTLSRAIPITNISSAQVVYIFSTHLLIRYRNPDIILLLFDNGEQFISEVFISLCNYPGVEK